MYELMFDLGIVFLFVVFLFLVWRQRDRHFEYYPQSWKAMMVGGALLVLAGGINLAHALGRQQALWGSELQRAFRAMGMAIYLGGGLLVALGLARWLSSLVRIRSVAMQRLRQLAGLKAILSATHRHNDLDEMFKESLSQVMNVMGYRMGVIFKPTFCSSQMTLVAHQGVPIKHLFHFYDLYLKNPCYGEARSSQKVITTEDVNSLPEHGVVFSDQRGFRSLACVPITFSGKILGLLGLYDTKGGRFSFQEIQFLTSIGETLGIAAQKCLSSERSKRRRDYISAMENILNLAPQHTSLESTFSKFSGELKKTIEFDQLTLVLTQGPFKNATTLSVGESGGILVESKGGSVLGGEALRKTIISGEVFIDEHVDEGEGPDAAQSRAWGIKSRIILPLPAEGRVCGALCLGHKKPNFYSKTDARWLRPLTLLIAQVILQQELAWRLDKEKSMTESIRDFDGKLAGDEELRNLITDVASSLVTQLPRSFARVTLLSKGKNHLLNCALHRIRSEGIDLKEEVRFSLDELPWHRLTLEAGRPMLVNQSDPESLMSSREARLIMDRRIGSAILVPLMLNGRAVGVISVGEMRNWDRQPLASQEMDFVRHKAGQLSLALKEALLLRSNKLLGEKLRRMGESEKPAESGMPGQPELSDLSYQIANPLTSIRGSAELLKMRESHLSSDGLKYLGNIERGVDRIQESFDRFLCRAQAQRQFRCAEESDSESSIVQPEVHSA